MKTISSGLDTHLGQEVTTIASCWKIVRRDGQSFFFTDHDQNILFGGDLYDATSSYDRTAIASKGDFSVDNLEVAGIIDSAKITDEALRSGLFNRARVYVFIVNWKDTSQGALKLRTGWFGEVEQYHNGQFKTEIRGLAEAFSTMFIEVYAPECRTDFCSTKCKLLLGDYKVTTSVTSSPSRNTVILDSGFTAPSQGLDYGTVCFVDGENAGRVVEIIGYNATTKQVDLFEGVSYNITAATNVVVAPGCDKSLTRCKAYGNVINRRAEDYVPGNDQMMSYPNAV
jgi:uncharacterized phage protein (TIGR02218 family)